MTAKAFYIQGSFSPFLLFFLVSFYLPFVSDFIFLFSNVLPLFLPCLTFSFVSFLCLLSLLPLPCFCASFPYFSPLFPFFIFFFVSFLFFPLSLISPPTFFLIYFLSNVLPLFLHSFVSFCPLFSFYFVCLLLLPTIFPSSAFPSFFPHFNFSFVSFFPVSLPYLFLCPSVFPCFRSSFMLFLPVCLLQII